MSKQIRTEATDLLFDAILSLKDKAECYTFFEDICTINELMSLSQRFEAGARCFGNRRHIWRLPRRPAHLQRRSAVSIGH